MMLNTDIHNVSVETKMTAAQFATNTKRADKHNQFSDHFLKTMYTEIYENPFTLEEVDEARAVGLKGDIGLFSMYEDKIFETILR